MSKGYIENWNLFEELMEHILTKRLDVEPEFHPILFTEQVKCLFSHSLIIRTRHVRRLRFAKNC